MTLLEFEGTTGVPVVTSDGSVEDLRFLLRRDEDRDGEVELVVSALGFEAGFTVFTTDAWGFGEFDEACGTGPIG